MEEAEFGPRIVVLQKQMKKKMSETLRGDYQRELDMLTLACEIVGNSAIRGGVIEKIEKQTVDFFTQQKNRTVRIVNTGLMPIDITNGKIRIHANIDITIYDENKAWSMGEISRRDSTKKITWIQLLRNGDMAIEIRFDQEMEIIFNMTIHTEVKP